MLSVSDGLSGLMHFQPDTSGRVCACGSERGKCRSITSAPKMYWTPGNWTVRKWEWERCPPSPICPITGCKEALFPFNGITSHTGGGILTTLILRSLSKAEHWLHTHASRSAWTFLTYNVWCSSFSFGDKLHFWRENRRCFSLCLIVYYFWLLYWWADKKRYIL